ncbi:Type I restriction-modification system, specificity subunit S [Vibrio aestuarianus]|nr:Type I restriction-modification system, specificity subunit S [Vibrio aestuarianus]
MVPSGWERTSFGLLAEFRNGLNFTKADQGEAIKIVGVADFKDHSSLSSLGNLGVISVSNTVKDNDLIKSGDVLYVRSNGNKDLIGRCLFFPEVTEKLSFSGFTIRGRVTSKAILPNYLALLSRSEIVKQQFSKNGGGTNISNLSQQILNDVVVPLPSIEEQRKIAETLSTWDKAITTTEKLIEASKQQKKALMQQLLTGKKRLMNPETGKAFDDEWEYVRAGNVFLTRSNKKHNSDLPILAITQDQGAVPRELIDYKVSVTDDSISGYKVVEQGDFIISLRSFQGGIEYSRYKGICSPAYVILYPKLELVDGFYKYHLKSHPFIQAMKSRLEGIRDGKIISYKYFSEIKLPRPSLEEQQKIASVLTTADKEIEVLETKLAHLKQEKKALMQQLLTGKRRVKVNLDMEIAI